jgi:hypothetical protein
MTPSMEKCTSNGSVIAEKGGELSAVLTKRRWLGICGIYGTPPPPENFMDFISVLVYSSVAVVVFFFIRQAMGGASFARFVPARSKETEYRLEKTT